MKASGGRLGHRDRLVVVGLVGDPDRGESAVQFGELSVVSLAVALVGGQVDDAVELVVVDLVEAAADPRLLTVDRLDPRLGVLAELVEARLELLLEPLEHGRANRQALDLLDHRGGDNVLRDRVTTATLEAATTVVHVLALGRRRRHQAPAASTSEEAAIDVIPLAKPGVATPAVEHILDPIEGRAIDDRCMLPFELLPLPIDESDIEPVLQHEVDRAVFELHASTCPEAHILSCLDQALDRIGAGSIEAEQLRYKGRTLDVDGDPAFVALSHVDVPYRGENRPNPLSCFLALALTRFLAEVVTVVLGHDQADVVHEAIGAATLIREYHPLLHEVELDAQLGHH